MLSVRLTSTSPAPKSTSSRVALLVARFSAVSSSLETRSRYDLASFPRMPRARSAAAPSFRRSSRFLLRLMTSSLPSPAVSLVRVNDKKENKFFRGGFNIYLSSQASEPRLTPPCAVRIVSWDRCWVPSASSPPSSPTSRSITFCSVVFSVSRPRTRSSPRSKSSPRVRFSWLTLVQRPAVARLSASRYATPTEKKSE